MKLQISTRLLITLGAIVLLAGLLFLDFLRSVENDAAEIQTEHSALLQSSFHTIDTVLSQPALQLDAEFGDQLFDSLTAQAHIQLGLLTDSAGIIVNSTDSDRIGSFWADPAPQSSALEAADNATPYQTYMNPAGQVIGIMQLCADGGGNNACYSLYLESDSKQQLANSRRSHLQDFIVSTLLLSLALILILELLSRFIIKPAQQTIATIEEFTAGNHSIRCLPRGGWELRGLIDSVNKLFERILADQRNLLEKRTMYASLLETMGDGLITIQPNGTIESINGAAERLLGFSRKELFGANISLIFADETAQNSEAFLKRFIAENSNKNHDCHWEVLMNTRAGDKVPVRLSISNMIIDDKELYIGVLSDISDIKAMEEKLLTLNKQLTDTNEQLEQFVITDSLTGLFNRRHFDDVLSKELARATRQTTSLSLLIVDIDFFKQYNDRYGHLLGDDCLSRVGACMQEIFKRSGDFPARYGGEEFGIILPGCDGLDLQERAETLRRAIIDLAMPHADSKVADVVTVSIGAVTFKPEADIVVAPKPRELFTEADKALYRAKGNGRNCVEFAGLFQPLPAANSGGPLLGPILSR